MELTTIADLAALEEGDLRKALRQVQLLPRIESYLEDLNLAKRTRSLGVFSASDIGANGGKSLDGKYTMGCGRKLWYRYIGEEPQEHIDPRLRRIFDTGKMIHLQLQDYLKEICKASGDAEEFMEEFRMDLRTSKTADILDIESTADGLYVIKEPDLIRFGLEIKSINTDEFKTLSKPKEEHVVQSHVYLGCLDLPVFIILYYDKNTSAMAEYIVKFNLDLWEAIVRKINFVRDCAIEEREPPQEPGFHCRTCRYAHVCKPPKVGSSRVQTGKAPRFRL